MEISRGLSELSERNPRTSILQKMHPGRGARTVLKVSSFAGFDHNRGAAAARGLEDCQGIRTDHEQQVKKVPRPSEYRRLVNVPTAMADGAAHGIK